jgi:hypothetical protein
MLLASVMTEAEMIRFFQANELQALAFGLGLGKLKTETAAAKAVYWHFHEA